MFQSHNRDLPRGGSSGSLNVPGYRTALMAEV
jgi:hypothetical protein